MGVLIGGINFTELKVLIYGASNSAGEPVYIYYGKFLQAVLDFTIIAFAIFMMVRMMNQIQSKFEKKTEEVQTPTVETTKEEALLAEIRDILKEKQKDTD